MTEQADTGQEMGVGVGVGVGGLKEPASAAFPRCVCDPPCVAATDADRARASEPRCPGEWSTNEPRSSLKPCERPRGHDGDHGPPWTTQREYERDDFARQVAILIGAASAKSCAACAVNESNSGCCWTPVVDSDVALLYGAIIGMSINGGHEPVLCAKHQKVVDDLASRVLPGIDADITTALKKAGR